MDFIFKAPADLRLDSLYQGDVIERKDAVVEAISQAHQYYANAPHYTHFVVITQSCDLARRGGNFNAPYITISAARPLRLVIDDYLKTKEKTISSTNFKYHSPSEISRTKQLIERHINNTEPDYFFLPKAGNEKLHEDLIVFLRLSIALRKDHYDVLAKSKIGELTDVFQAKIGWLKGNIYSRVATPDLDELGHDSKAIKAQYYRNYVENRKSIQLSSLQSERLGELARVKAKDLGRNLSEDEATEIVKGLRSDAEILAEKVVDRLIKNGLIDRNDDVAVRKAISSVANTPSIKTLVNR